MKGLVLGGGGAKGAYQLGVAKALEELNYRPRVVSGTSVGAINGAFMAAGVDSEAGARMWCQMTNRRVAPRRRDYWNVFKWPSISTFAGLRSWLEENLDMEAVNSSDTKLFVTAVNEDQGVPQTWTQPDLSIDRILASSAIPGIYPPVEIDGTQYIDGGVLRNTPLRPVLNEGCDEIVVVTMQPHGPDHVHHTHTILGLLSRVSEIISQRNLEEEVELARHGVNWKLWGLLPHRRKPEVTLIRPQHDLKANAFFYSKEQTQYLMEQGYHDAIRCMVLGEDDQEEE